MEEHVHLILNDEGEDITDSNKAAKFIQELKANILGNYSRCNLKLSKLRSRHKPLYTTGSRENISLGNFHFRRIF
ncbi:unnamed protein product [Acanthoscelides obtectus]|uniref:Uncharacterized protein n=1 Tax=Acanthoscelides obtectus TaxID=200917 RepID=A0A9P0PWG0_ACAOB|nr:unnamed protein product [Acanthoscelides obtectus]CAK1663061.1 hypothetical protein AOBTE_LOCUS23464 [Acanthoscelides obtectus]